MKTKEILSSMNQPNETGSSTAQTVARTPTNASLRPAVSTPTSDKCLPETTAKSLLDAFVPSAEDLEPYLSVNLACFSEKVGK